MDIHKPKPWHGLREFLKEYLIIVIGVLTALAAEQAVEWVHRRIELGETRDAIRAEVARNAEAAEVTAYEDGCLIGYDDRLIAWAKGGPAPGPAVTISPFFSTTVWDGSQAGALNRMPLKEKFAYGRFYEALRNEQALAVSQRAQAQTLGRYFALDDLTGPERRSLQQDAYLARSIHRIKVVNANDLLGMARELRVRPEPIKPITRQLLADECRLAGLPVPRFDAPAE